MFQVQFLNNSAVVNESAAADSNLGIQILIAPFAILQSRVTVTLSIATSSTATGAVMVIDGLAT